MNHSDVIIIGAGLTGLTIAYLLKNQNINVQILEARDRIGGRILTKYKDGTVPMDMGATWLGRKHSHLNQLLKELDIDVFIQEMGSTAVYEPISTSPPQLVQLPPNSDPSFRIKGGSSALINALFEHLDENQIHYNQVVKSIEEDGEKLLVKTEKEQFESSIVLSTLPPFLLSETIKIEPALPNNVSSIAQQTHTWMGESIKIGLEYKEPFWRADNLSGTIVSNVGPIPEMYDHSNQEESYYGLIGFLNGAYFSVTKEERISLIMNQLAKYFGNKAKNYISYEEKVWRREPYTFSNYHSSILPHQNNGHPLFRQAYLNNKFYIAGAETAANFPGYMDGAVQSARFVFNAINLTLDSTKNHFR